MQDVNIFVIPPIPNFLALSCVERIRNPDYIRWILWFHSRAASPNPRMTGEEAKMQDVNIFVIASHQERMRRGNL